MIQVGTQVPDFTVSDQNGNSVSLSDYNGQKVAVFFYPKASTPGCTAEACDLRDPHGALQAAGYAILGVSADDVPAQSKFATKYELPFPLLADVDKTVINIFGVWGPKKVMGRDYEGIHRVTFLLDQQGVVSHVIDKVKTKEHAAQILEA